MPTGAPTGTPTAGEITGDPHVTNVEGQRFSLARVGVHELLRLPRRPGAGPGQGAGSEALLEVLGTVESEEKCAEPFVRQLDLSGLWLRQSGPLFLRAGGLSMDSKDAIMLQVNGTRVGEEEFRVLMERGLLQVAKPTAEQSERHGAKARREKYFTAKFRFPGATITVDWIHREVPGSSLNHLDLHVADLPRLEDGMDVGGILGRDDHASAAGSSPDCKPTQNLMQFDTGLDVSGSLLKASYEH
jgi:hypothetical protein